ncbi:cytochrome P450 76A1 [Silene latifolia]|uniref:cytochrome P450 76A1 n=1 Tax=Silene latifolia TaxID=37657 RepID=UPI003D77464C
MEIPYDHPYSSILLILIPVITLLWLRNARLRRLPPGPRGWPIIGNMLDLGTMPHRTLAALATKHGPVIWLRLGSQKIIVIQTAKAASDLFKYHDLAFADRNINETMRVHDYHNGSLILAPYGPHLRLMKKLLATEMLVSKRIRETESIREKCVDDLIEWISAAGRNAAIEVGRIVFVAEFNLLGNLMLSKDIVDPSLTNGSEFFTAMNGLTQWTGLPNVSDFFPWVRWMDLQGLKKKTEQDMKRVFEITSSFVKERREEIRMGRKKDRKDILDLLLEFEGHSNDEPQKISDHHINIFLSEFLMAGTESTASTVEWAMTQLLANPDWMFKVKSELDQVVGPNRKVKEANIDELPYLQAVVKETFRLHPPVPFLVPRKAVEDTTFMGYNVCRGTQVFVNIWAIGRDPQSWDDPLVFKPERFIGSKTDYRGHDYEFLPFGAGRRMCAGIPLAHQMLHLTLGALLYSFDWELESGVTPDTIDWADRIGLTAKKLVPLKAITTKRKA